MIIYHLDSTEEISFIFNDTSLSYSVTFNKPIPTEVISFAAETIKTADLNCYVFDKADVGIVQIYFEYKQNLYIISFNNKQDLIEIIENLKELQ